MSYWMDELKKPGELDVGLKEEERQGIYNLGRRQMQGAWTAGAEQLKESIGSQGFRAGESGRADTALGGLYAQGAESLGKYGQEIALSEATNRFNQNATVEGLRQSRLLGGGQLEAQHAATSASAGAASDRLKFDKSRWRNEFAASQQQQQFNNFYNIWRGQSAYQSDAYGQYASAGL